MDRDGKANLNLIKVERTFPVRNTILQSGAFAIQKAVGISLGSDWTWGVVCYLISWLLNAPEMTTR